MILRLAWKNLVADLQRSLVALAGVVFAVVLVVVQLGFVLGSAENSSCVVDHASADVWVLGRETANFDFARPIPERRYHQVLGTPGVERAERMVLTYAQWRTRSGGQEKVLLVGVEPEARLAGPWNFEAGLAGSVRGQGAVVVDVREAARLGGAGGPLEAGDRFELNGKRARVAGFTRGVGSFTTVPYVFTTVDDAIEFSAELDPDEITYVLATASPGTTPAALAERLGVLPHVEVLTAEAFRDRTRRYWIFGTGLGLGWCLTALLGLVVGVVIVGQTICAMTLENRREYATLRAIGYDGRSLASVVMVQAAILGTFGYAIGLGIAAFVVQNVSIRSVAIRISRDLALGVLGLTACLCVVASISSIWRIVRTEPAVVFRD